MVNTFVARAGSIQKCIAALSYAFLISCCPTASAAPTVSFSEAMSEAKRLAKTDTGFRYKLKIAAELQQALVNAAIGCSSSSSEQTFAFVLIVAADGRIEEVIHTPKHPLGACVAQRIKGTRVSRPPHGEWRVNFAMNSVPGKWWINVTMHPFAPAPETI